MIRLNALLRERGIDPSDVAILLHTPKEAKLRQSIAWIAANDPELFDIYQSTHSKSAEATLKKRPLVLSFVAIGKNRLALAGLFRIDGWEERLAVDIDQDPAFQPLFEDWGVAPRSTWPGRGAGSLCCQFTLKPDPLFDPVKGRLIISVLKGRAYARLAENLDAEVIALAETSQLTAPPPDWRWLIVQSPDFAILPQEWVLRLSEWRGICLIVDESDGARYVGAAYGAENLYGRWRAHVARQHGVTKELAHRKTRNFRFSILERVSPDMEPEDVINLEQSWMLRLHSREFGFNQ